MLGLGSGSGALWLLEVTTLQCALPAQIMALGRIDSGRGVLAQVAVPVCDNVHTARGRKSVRLGSGGTIFLFSLSCCSPAIASLEGEVHRIARV
jgi:hypothetical protein